MYLIDQVLTQLIDAGATGAALALIVFLIWRARERKFVETMESYRQFIEQHGDDIYTVVEASRMIRRGADQGLDKGPHSDDPDQDKWIR